MAGPSAPGATAADATRTGTETYLYTATPSDADSGSAEIHHVEITTDSTGVVYSFHTQRANAAEFGVIRTRADGTFVDAVRRVVGADGVTAETDSFRVDGRGLVMERVVEDKSDIRRVDLPDDEPLVVDASLLVWLRGLPLGESVSRSLFVADWSRRTVHVDVHDRGPETVTVPAGSFVCNRIEVVVKVFVFRPRITFWMSAEPPYFLVRHRGKRGPFTPVFDTELVRKGQP
jgi:hypothetical protein